MPSSSTGPKSSIPSGTTKHGTPKNYAMLGGLPPKKNVEQIDKENMPKRASGSIRKGA